MVTTGSATMTTVGVADALGCRDIDLQAVRDWDEDQAIERKGCGCDTCGHGDLVVVRGILA